MKNTFTSFLYGADYNPEQWAEEVWLDDMRLMKVAGVNMVTINVFSWAMLESAPDHYHFGQLDRIMHLLADYDIGADLATATASPPTWMSRLYPEMLPVTWDGKRYSHGSRQHYCPNSVDYRERAVQLVRRLAERYQGHPALKMWHVNNEYGCHVAACYCERCAVAFREWLRERYQTLDALNAAWGTAFWSQHYFDWEDIEPPRFTPAQNNPGQRLDYHRFMSDALLDCYLLEANILREVTPDVPITTNFMAAFKPLDYMAWAPHLDMISFDNYPSTSAQPWEVALTHDLMRSLKGGQPYLVMEQSPSQLNWMPQGPHKRPGAIRLQSLQAVAHGADGVMYFQWRQSQVGAEKFHSAIVSHDGTEEARIFKQVAKIGAELQRLSPDVVGSRITAEVAIVMDWQNWWSAEYQPGLSNRLNYWEQIKVYYHALHRLNVAIDIVSPGSDLSAYRVVVAPFLHMLRSGVANNLERFVEHGGTLLTTYFSGIVDEDDHVVLGGYPAELRKMLGIHVEEFDPWTPEMTNEVVVAEGDLQGRYSCTLCGELLHLEGAQAIGVFASDYYANGPALTVHGFGEGHAYYLATQGSDELLAALLRLICREAGVRSILDAAVGETEGETERVEVTRRVRADGRSVYFLLNHSVTAETVILPAGRYVSLLDGRELTDRVEIGALDVVVVMGRSESTSRA